MHEECNRGAPIGEIHLSADVIQSCELTHFDVVNSIESRDCVVLIPNYMLKSNQCLNRTPLTNNAVKLLKSQQL